MGKKNRSKRFRVTQPREERLQALRISRENNLTMNKPRKPVEPSFIAKFDGGECPSCYLKIEKGQRVRYNLDDVLVHARHEKKEVPVEICSSCFLTLPCECGT